MNKSIGNVKSNETIRPLTAKPIHSRSDPSIKPSLHPWYYVKGRKDLTEKNISSRREREDQKHRQSVSNNQYFNKRLAETQVFDKWIDNKSLTKQPKQQTNDYSLKPPFDVLIETKSNSNNIRLNKELEKKYLKSKQRLTQFMDKFNEMNTKYSELEKQQNILFFHLNEIKTIKISFEEKKQFCESNEKHLKYLRFGREKLRKKVFQIMDQLNCYKILVKKIQLLHKCRPALSQTDMIEMNEVVDRALKILDLYADINENRNKEFQLLFDEESEDRWEPQEEEWKIESQVWNVMIEKLIDSYKNIFKDKLNQLLSKQKTLLKEREEEVKQLTEFTTKIKLEPQLSVLLKQDISAFMTDVIES